MLLNGRYEYNPATDLLGKGGLAEVFKAYDKETGRYVAIKKFTATDENLKYSLKSEFQKSLQLAHDNLVRAYDFFTVKRTFEDGETHETQYGVMELIEGGDLNQYLQKQPHKEELLQVVKGILQGLHYLHTPNAATDKGIIIHRDIKPGNILIYYNQQGQPIPKITDFNIAKETATTTEHSQSMVGTYEYMAPEQLNPNKYGINGKVQPNADLWALGVILYDYFNTGNTSLFGKRAHGDSEGHIISNILDKPIPADAIKKLRAPFNGIVARCLVRPAKDRIESAKDLLKWIDKEEEKTITTPPLPDAGKTTVPQPAAPRNYTKAGFIAGFLLLLCGVIYMALPERREVVPENSSTLTDTTTTIADTNNTPITDKPDTAVADIVKPDGRETQIQQLFAEANALFVDGKYSQAKAKAEAVLNSEPANRKAKALLKKCEAEIQKQANDNTRQPATQEVKPPTTTKTANDPFASQMVYVQGGTFTMGCTEEQGNDCYDEEKPAHSRTVRSFYISKYEVTQAQWQSIMNNNPSEYSGCAQCPIETVSWNDIQEFLSKLNTQTGKNYRLPTEAEWEYAARGGNKNKGYKYAGSNDIDRVAWYIGNSSEGTHPVGQKSPNELGLYDMSGNVLEWCSDWFKGYPGNSTDYTGSNRVLRGGSWRSKPQWCRVACRGSNRPTNRFESCGFRLVCVPQ
ncbi:hypothetical protein C7N43_36220 [Sphingobacteriales bacterium UPWRP_1]|nr:hypothetical protein BVG80_00530 [Sphingobacteriales bacterium TSM_CSM]PSJ72050.1 hypothetical protein C7N43_36220 [Sphingobacteriales bacterium UPWRP_1]